LLRSVSASPGSARADIRAPIRRRTQGDRSRQYLYRKDWSIGVRGPATILEAPEGGSWIALVDVPANGPDQALSAAWRAYKPEAKWPVKVSHDLPDQDGWSRNRSFAFENHLNRSTEAEFVRYLNGIRPALSRERLQLALKIFRENSRA
jgi:hypothetical protein